MHEAETATDNVVALPTRSEHESPTQAVTDFVREHPLLVVGGGIAAGVIVGALLPRGAGRKLARRATELAELGAAAAVTLGHQAAETAESATAAGAELGRTAREKAQAATSAGADFGRHAWDRAENAAGALGKRGEAAAGDILAAASDTAQRIARIAAELAGRLQR